MRAVALLRFDLFEHFNIGELHGLRIVRYLGGLNYRQVFFYISSLTKYDSPWCR